MLGIKKSTTTSQKGFTLIETLICIGLLGVMLVGGIVGVYNILEGSGRTKEAMYREQDASFVLRKIDSVLSEAESISSANSDELVVNTESGLVRFNLADGQIFIQRESDTPLPLHDIFLSAEDVDFIHSVASSTLRATFVLDGQTYSLDHFLP